MEKIRSSVQPTLPISIELVAPANENSVFSMIGDKTFYQGEVTFGEQRAVILSHTDHLNELLNHENWFIDETFKIRPLRSFFSQIMILSIKSEGFIPIVYALMSSRFQGLYSAIF